LLAGAVSAVLAGYVLLALRPGPPFEGRVVAGYFIVGTVMSVGARFAPWHGVRAVCVVIGTLPSWLLGFAFLIQGKGGTSWIGVVLLATWAVAFHCVCFFGRAWTEAGLAGPGCCLNCGYDRRGLGVEAACPECGKVDV
jgi:hypothetical protein